MEWFKISYFAPGLLVDLIITLTVFLFLSFKKEQSPANRWLSLFFLGEACLALAYFLSYSILHEFAAFHRYLSCFIVLGNVCLVAFSYYYPKNERPKEAKLVIYFFLSMYALTYLHFIYNTIHAEKTYNFESHIYTFDFGKEIGILHLLLYLVSAFNFIRKTLRYSEYTGFFTKWLKQPKTIFSFYYLQNLIARFLSSWVKFLVPKGNYAEASRNFTLAIILHIFIAVANVLVKNGSISYYLYANIFVLATMFIVYYITVVYINHSLEPTSFMIKLIGITLGMVLLILGYVANVTLTEVENSYDDKKRLEIQFLQQTLSSKEPQFSKNISYVLLRKNGIKMFSQHYTMIYQREPSLKSNDFSVGDKKLKDKLVTKKYQSINQNYDKTPKDQIFRKAKNHIEKRKLRLLERNYRNANGNFFVFYLFAFESKIYEVGFSYENYRETIHNSAQKLILAMLVSTAFILFVFPILFKKSIVTPLRSLLKGVKKVNRGNLEVQVPIKINDEIGYLSTSFNSMVESIREAKKELQMHAENLEQKVEERTQEISSKMQEIQNLKIQQDGDYYLTSLLAKPLYYNANKSKTILTDFVIEQKKQFEFRKKKGELGGDICVTGNLRIGKPNNYQRYVVAMNGDAMGKSMQGAGGSLVMGVVMNSILSRSAANDRVLDTTPEDWLTDTYKEIQSVFKSFDGTMVISASIFVIAEEDGNISFINAEHPFSVLYRDGKASFLENKIYLRKFGIDSEFSFEIKKFKLLPGDIVLLGSDGKDDIRLPETAQVNEDETLFLQSVEDSRADLPRIIDILKSSGELIDDVSLLRIECKEYTQKNETATQKSMEDQYLLAKNLVSEEKLEQAFDLMYDFFENNKTHQKLNKLLALISFKLEKYQNCIEVINTYKENMPEEKDLLYYLSIAQKKQGLFEAALETAEEYLQQYPDSIRGLITLADIQRIQKQELDARNTIVRVLQLDPKNKMAQQIFSILQKDIS
ncbi:MAG: SpoIIE family protein phosphatase [Spirochaetota bacterium]